MTGMFWKRRNDDGGDRAGRQAVRRIFEAASATPGDGRPSPFFVARVRATAAERRSLAVGHPLGTVAWQMIPAFAVIVLGLSAWTGYESAAAARDRAEVVTNLLRQKGGASEIIITAMLMDPASGSGGAE
jgi:hypothetical protein